MSNATQAPAAPAVTAAPAAVTSPESRSGDGAESSRPAGSANITGAELSAKFAADRRARRSHGVAGSPKSQGAPAKQTSSARQITPATGETGAAESDEEHAASPPAGESAVIDELAQGGESQGGEPQNAEGQAAAEKEAAAAEPSLEDLLDDPESATEDQIKSVKDRGIRKLLSRVHKLTARLKEAERGVQAGREQDAGEALPVGSDPEVVQIEGNLALLREAAQWARKNPDGGEFRTSKGKVIGTYSAEQVEGILANAPEQIATLAGELSARKDSLRRERQQVTRSSLDQAAKAYPWFAKPDTEEYAEALAIVQQAPYIKSHPEWPMWVADAIAGRRARLAQGESAAKPKTLPRPTPPKVPPPSSAAAPRVDPAAKALSEAEAAYSKSGSENDLKVVLRLRRQARTRR